MRNRLLLMIAAMTLSMLAVWACGGENAGQGAGSVPVSGSIELATGDNYFQYKGKKQPNIVVQAGSEITVNLTNKGTAIHNMRVAGLDDSFNSSDDFISKPTTLNAGEKGTLTFKFARAGTYRFHCDFHPESTGTITVS